ncbi:thiosulfate transporter subunit [Citrobacter koseri]|uniref:Thiosulfate transporter subunit n=1 Tax=Citrobacter koseri TaxID=545 RepID=A0A2X2VXZ1_CITKO|nr:thiosulfate transporter subunit [Citrobacter koseri]
MAVNLLKKRYLALSAMLLLATQAQATELLNSSYRRFSRTVCRP